MTMESTPLKKANGAGHPCSDAQLAAGKRNFALFVLKGMMGHLTHLQGHIRTGEHLRLEQAIKAALADFHAHTPPSAAKPRKGGKQHGTTTEDTTA